MEYNFAQELQHMGTKGMKWGVRRFQNEDGTLTALGKERYGRNGERSARKTKWDLNKLDREQTNARVNYDYYNSKAVRGVAKAQKKIRKAEARGDSEKVDKLNAKIDKINNTTGKKASDYKDLLDRSKKLTRRIIETSKAKGYSIHSRETLRAVNRGNSAAASALGTGLGMVSLATLGVGGVYSQSEYAQGNHYRVRNDGLGTETHRSRRFSSEPHIRR